MVKTYVVNLERSAERRRHIIAECERHGLNFEIVDAIDGLLLPDEEFDAVIDKEIVGQNPGYFSKGMLACSLSHLRVYEKFLNDGGDAAFIIEDDVGFDPGVAALIETTASKLSLGEVALLFYMSRDPLQLSQQNTVKLVEDRRLLYPMTLAWVGSTGALWSESKTLFLQNPSAEQWAFEFGDEPTTDDSVEAFSLTDLMAIHAIDKIDILKVDIEGAEKEVFSGDLHWLDSVDSIFVEIHDRLVEGAGTAIFRAMSKYQYYFDVRFEYAIFDKIKSL